MVTARAIDYGLLNLPDSDALREHLDNLNEAGETPVVVGVDSSPQSFLITLVGPYAEGEDGVWVPKPRRCDECNAVSHGIEDLRFPVVVMVKVSDGRS